MNPGITDPSRVEASLREQVIELPDGSVKLRMDSQAAAALSESLLNDHKNYTRVRSPALAIYAETFVNVTASAPGQRAIFRSWEEKHAVPFRRRSIERLRRELDGVEVLTVPGTHGDFLFTSRQAVADAMNRFFRA